MRIMVIQVENRDGKRDEPNKQGNAIKNWQSIFVRRNIFNNNSQANTVVMLMTIDNNTRTNTNNSTCTNPNHRI